MIKFERRILTTKYIINNNHENIPPSTSKLADFQYNNYDYHAYFCEM